MLMMLKSAINSHELKISVHCSNAYSVSEEVTISLLERLSTLKRGLLRKVMNFRKNTRHEMRAEEKGRFSEKIIKIWCWSL